MLKKLITLILILTLLPINSFADETYNTTAAVAIPDTYVDDYLITLITLMGIGFTTQMERDVFVGEFKERNSMYSGDILEEAERILIEYNKNHLPPLPGQDGPGNNDPEKKMIALPIIPGLIDSIKSFFEEENPPTEIDITGFSPVINYYRTYYNNNGIVLLIEDEQSYILRSIKPPLTDFIFQSQDIYNRFKITSGAGSYIMVSQSKSTGTFSSTNNSSNDIYLNYGHPYFYGYLPSVITPPQTVPINTNIISIYTGLRTITLPHPSAPRVNVPLSPDEYVEPVPDIYPGYIPTPQYPPNINPETGLPYEDENGVPILTPDIIVPGVEEVPVPEPEVLTQPKDYSPTLTKILNGIRQIPEKIVNPVKNIIVPPEIPQIDFSPLSVPLVRKFPFSIPFDLHNAFKGLDAEAAAPRWEIPLKIGYGAFLGTSAYDTDDNIVIDMAEFTTLANIARYFILLIFMVGLIIVTRIVIRG